MSHMRQACESASLSRVARLDRVGPLTHIRHMRQTEPMTTQPETDLIPEWTLGWRLQRSLTFAEMTVQGMADELGTSRGTISRWCNDHNRPRQSDLKLWALRTGVPFKWLLYGDDEFTSADSGHQSSNLRLESAPVISTAELPSLMKRIPLTRTAREQHIQAVAT